ncbi:MAG: hypothetical protein K2L95_02395 [Alphaproteobacteria bacterium]|nr:hypothetical protein [Alphaproteobacteria bacterium]
MRFFVLLMFIVGATAISGNVYADARVDCSYDGGVVGPGGWPGNGGITYQTCAESESMDGDTYSTGCHVINAATVQPQVASGMCTRSTTVWAYGLGFQDCETCVDGATKTSKTDTITFVNSGGMRRGTCNIGYNVCTCTKTATCTDGPWTTIRAGYQSRIKSTAVCNTCKTSTEYRCAPGYYGSTSNGSTGCTQCPSVDGVAGTSAGGNGTTITSCYVSTGTTFSNSSGSGRYDGNSYYCG